MLGPQGINDTKRPSWEPLYGESYRPPYKLLQISVAETKDAAAQKYEQFMAFFAWQFDCRRTDRGGEYQTLDLFCKENGIARQISESRNQASNGKADRMHHTIMNMVRCMIYDCGLSLCF